MTTETADAVIERADAYYFRGRCDEAIMLLEDFIARTSDPAGVAVRAAELLVDSERYAQALEYLKPIHAVEANPRAAFLYALCHLSLGNADIAESIADRIMKQKGKDAYALALKARLAAFDRQKPAVVERLLSEAVEHDPECGIAWLDFALLRRQEGDLQAWFNFARRAFECAPEAREIAVAFHEASLLAERLSEADSAFREALSGRRANRRLRYFLIDLLLRQNKNAEAMAEVESAIVDFGVDKGILGAALKIREHLGPIGFPPAPKSGGRVSLCVIAKNEEHRLARCLASAKPFVDEMIVVDTGSTDATKDLAKAMGARVYDFEWEDDFSKARNFSLSKASGDWVLVLDADEAISPQDRGRFPALTKSVPTPAVAYCIRTRNYTFHANTLAWHPNDGSYPDEEQGVGWFPSEKVRLFPNHAGIRFSHPVHELVEPSLRELKIPIQACDIPVHHYGNLKEEKTLGKIRDYRAIGEKKLSHAPEEPAALRELAIQSSHLDRHAEAIDLWRRYLEKVPHSAEAYLNLGSACWQLGRYGEAREHAKTAQRIDGSLKEAAFNRALAELLLGKAGIVIKILERLLRKTPGYLQARFILAAAYACSGKARKAGAVLQAVEPTPLGAHLAESFYDLATRLRDGAQTAYCEKLIAAATATGHADARFAALLESIRPARTAA